MLSGLLAGVTKGSAGFVLEYRYRHVRAEFGAEGAPCAAFRIDGDGGSEAESVDLGTEGDQLVVTGSGAEATPLAACFIYFDPAHKSFRTMYLWPTSAQTSRNVRKPLMPSQCLEKQATDYVNVIQTIQKRPGA